MSESRPAGGSPKKTKNIPREAEDGRPSRLRRLRGLLVLLLVACGMTGYLLLRTVEQPQISLRMTAGDRDGQRYTLAGILKTEAGQRRLEIELLESNGSEQSLEMVASRQVDVALVQGGLPARTEVLQVAVLVPEPLHILAKPHVIEQGLGGLKGARLNLSRVGSGTRVLSEHVLEKLGLRGEDSDGEAWQQFEESNLSYNELRQAPFDDSPDAVFLVSAVPSSVAETLIGKGYGLMELPMANALHSRLPALQEFEIPAYTYGALPAVPARPIKTVAPMLSLVAHRDVPVDRVLRLMEAMFDADFAIHAKLPPLQAAEVLTRRELPLHPGAQKYLNRNQPAFDGQLIEGIENLRSFIVSALVAAFLMWRWYQGRRQVGFEQFFDQATRIEFEALQLQQTGQYDKEAHERLQGQLSQLKSVVLEQFAGNRLRGAELLSGFLAHVADVRQCLAT